MFIDLVSDGEEQMSPTSLESLCRVFEIPYTSFIPTSLPPCIESPESPNDNTRHPCDVCPELYVEEEMRSVDTDLRFDLDHPIDPTSVSLLSPEYLCDNDVLPHTSQELDDALRYLPSTPCPTTHNDDLFTSDLAQRLMHLENQQRRDSATLEGMINTLAVDVVNLTQRLNQRLTQFTDLLQQRRSIDGEIHRHTGDILAQLIYHPTLHQQLAHDLLDDIQRLRRRSLFE